MRLGQQNLWFVPRISSSSDFFDSKNCDRDPILVVPRVQEFLLGSPAQKKQSESTRFRECGKIRKMVPAALEICFHTFDIGMHQSYLESETWTEEGSAPSGATWSGLQCFLWIRKYNCNPSVKQLSVLVNTRFKKTVFPPWTAAKS